MNQFGLITEIAQLRRQQEILKEAAIYHLANEAVKAKRSDNHTRAKILVWVGVQLSSVGHSLLEHYNDQLASNNTGYEKSNTRDCA